MDVVNGVEDEAAAWGEVVQTPAHLVAHLLDGAVRQDMLGIAALEARSEVLRIVLEGASDVRGVVVRNRDDDESCSVERKNCTLLMMAATNPAGADCLRLLLEHKADPNAVDSAGETVDAYLFWSCLPMAHATSVELAARKHHMERWSRVCHAPRCVVTSRTCVMKRCGRCHAVWYCSKTCQRDDWPFAHKRGCV